VQQFGGKTQVPTTVANRNPNTNRSNRNCNVTNRIFPTSLHFQSGTCKV